MSFFYNPLIRAPPYIVGLYLGISYKEFRVEEKNALFDRVAIRSNLNYVISFGGLALIVFVVYFPHYIDTGSEGSTLTYFWQVFGRILMTFGFSFFMAPMLAGRLEWLSSAIGSLPFRILAKLVFSAYLVS